MPGARRSYPERADWHRTILHRLPAEYLPEMRMVAHKLRFDTDCLHIISKDAPHVNSPQSPAGSIHSRHISIVGAGLRACPVPDLHSTPTSSPTPTKNHPYG